LSTNKFKIVIFGDGGVGKTTLVNRYLKGVFTSGAMTIGVDFHLKVMDIQGNKIVLQIWDYAGQDRFRFLFPSYVSGSEGAIFMFDVTRYSSIKSLSEWMEAFKRGFDSDDVKIPKIMVGGKIDLDIQRSISRQDAEELAKKYNFDEYIECSSKTGENVEIIFNKLALKLIEKKV